MDPWPRFKKKCVKSNRMPFPNRVKQSTSLRPSLQELKIVPSNQKVSKMILIFHCVPSLGDVAWAWSATVCNQEALPPCSRESAVQPWALGAAVWSVRSVGHFLTNAPNQDIFSENLRSGSKSLSNHANISKSPISFPNMLSLPPFLLEALTNWHWSSKSSLLLSFTSPLPIAVGPNDWDADKHFNDKRPPPLKSVRGSSQTASLDW